MVFVVEERRAVLMPSVPLVFARSKHAIVSVFLNNQFGCSFSVSWIGSPELSVSFENIGQPLSSERRLSVNRGNWRS